MSSPVKQLPDLLGGDRKLDILYAKRPQGIQHGVGNRRRSADGSCFSDTLDTERIPRAQRFSAIEQEIRDAGRPRYGVIEQTAGGELAVVRIHDLLE